MEQDRSYRRRQRERIFRLVEGVGAVALLSFGFLIGNTTKEPPPTYAAVGTVACAHGEVEGVWIDAGSRSGWANTSPRTGTADQVAFFREIGAPNYQAHVGCDGTPEHWAQSEYSPTAPVNMPLNFNCDAGVCTEEPMARPAQ